jgi:hypothetical protein
MYESEEFIFTYFIYLFSVNYRDGKPCRRQQFLDVLAQGFHKVTSGLTVIVASTVHAEVISCLVEVPVFFNTVFYRVETSGKRILKDLVRKGNMVVLQERHQKTDIRRAWLVAR